MPATLDELSHLYAQQGESSAAEALRLADGNGYRALAGEALIVLAGAALATGDHEAAAGHCRAARTRSGAPGRLREIARLERASAERAGAARSVLV